MTALVIRNPIMDRAEWKRRQADGIARAKRDRPDKYTGRRKGSRNKTRNGPPLEEIIFVVSVVRRLESEYLDEVYGHISEIPPRRMWRYKWEFETTGKITIPDSPPCPALKNMKHKAAAFFSVSPSTLYRWLREHPNVRPADVSQIKDAWWKWLDHSWNGIEMSPFRRWRPRSTLGL